MPYLSKMGENDRCTLMSFLPCMDQLVYWSIGSVRIQFEESIYNSVLSFRKKDTRLVLEYYCRSGQIMTQSVAVTYHSIMDSNGRLRSFRTTHAVLHNRKINDDQWLAVRLISTDYSSNSSQPSFSNNYLRFDVVSSGQPFVISRNFLFHIAVVYPMSDISVPLASSGRVFLYIVVPLRHPFAFCAFSEY